MGSSIWPDGIRCGVALTFDVDAETLWFSRNPTSKDSPGLLSEGIYGPRVGIPRILKMLERTGVKATFFVPGWVVEQHTNIIQEVVSQGHEIGYHGYLHEPAESPRVEAQLIRKCRDIMHDTLGLVPIGHRAPEASLHPGTLEMLAREGMEYSSTLMDADRPYVHEVDAPTPLVQLPTSWLYDDSSHFFFTLQDPPRRPIASHTTVFEIWKAEFDGIYDEGGSMVLMMHPQIIGRVSRVRMLEQLVTYMKSRPGTLVAPAYELVEAFRRGL